MSSADAYTPTHGFRDDTSSASNTYVTWVENNRKTYDAMIERMVSIPANKSLHHVFMITGKEFKVYPVASLLEVLKRTDDQHAIERIRNSEKGKFIILYEGPNGKQEMSIIRLEKRQTT